MDSSDEIAIDLSPIIRVYRNGHVEHLHLTSRVPPSVDPVAGVASKDIVIQPTTGVSARLYRPNAGTAATASKLPVLVYFHGGGFCIESAFSSLYHCFLNSLVSRAGVVAVSVDYRLAPQNPPPAAYDDAWVALQWVSSHAVGCGGGPEPWLSAEHADFSRVFFAGDSAGANIAHNMLIRAGAEGLGSGGGSMAVEGVMLLDPYFWGTERLPSEVGRVDRPMITLEMLDRLWPFISGGAGNDDPRINPMADGAPSLASLACRRVLVAVAEKDTLRNRGRAYCEALRKSGWGGDQVQLLETTGEDHCFYLFKPGCREADAMINKLVAFLNEVRE